MSPQLPSGQRLGLGRGITVALLCWVLIAGLYLLRAFEPSDLRLLDLRFQLRGPRTASERIAIVEIDDATIEDYKRWPLPRDQYALLIEALAAAQARVVGMDLLFLGNDFADPRFDDLLAQVTAMHPGIVHAITFVPGQRARDGPAGPRPEIEAALGRHGLRGEGVPAPRAAEVTTPEPGLLEAATAVGHVVLHVDHDGVVRRVPPFVRYGGRLYPSLALEVASLAATGHALSRATPAPHGIILGWADGAKLRIPVDGDSVTGVDFAGDRDAFPRSCSMVDVLRWYAEGDTARLRREFGGRIVLVGATAVAQVATDVSSTPFSPNTPLLYVHANAVDSFLRGRFLTRLPAPTYVIGLGALAALLGWLFVALSLPWAAAAAAIALLAVAGSVQALFAAWSLDVPPTAALLLSPLAYAAVASYRFIFLEHRARERQKELRVAREIQRRLLPTEPPRLAGLDVWGVNLPAQEVGGDYYDWLPIGDGRLAVALGDVSGKGVAAALLMSHLRASLHAETREGASPAEIATAMHASLFRAIESGRFATFFLATFERGGTQLRYCNAGHNPGLLVRGAGLEQLEATGVPLGIFEDAVYATETRSFEPGDVMVLYSDGISECPWKDEMYGEERLQRLVLELCARGLGARAIVEGILADVEGFAHGPVYGDDVTVVVVRRSPA